MSGPSPLQSAATLREKAGCIAEDEKSLALGRKPKRISLRPVQNPVNVLNELSWLLGNEWFRK
jgi:hypothetical protein